MATIFSREEKAEALFGEILKNPEACRRLMDTFNDSLDMADVLDAPAVSAQQFAAALFNAYENKDLSAFLMAICQHSMFDLLRNAALIPFKFNADGQPNPVILTDDAGVLLPNNEFAVSSKVYDRFIRVFQKQEKVKNVPCQRLLQVSRLRRRIDGCGGVPLQPAFGAAADLRTAGHREAEGNGSGGLLHRLGYPDEAAARTAPFRGLLWTGYAQGRRNPLR